MGVPDNCLEGLLFLHAQSPTTACLSTAHCRICCGWKPYVVSLKGGIILIYEA